jgi:beta-lactam-binding protein with PASTA domain
MKKLIYILFVISIIVSFTSCAIFQTSMTPTEVYKTLPTLTKSNFLTALQSENLNCKCLQKRSYTAPIGMTVKRNPKLNETE